MISFSIYICIFVKQYTIDLDFCLTLTAGKIKGYTSRLLLCSFVCCKRIDLSIYINHTRDTCVHNKEGIDEEE